MIEDSDVDAIFVRRLLQASGDVNFEVEQVAYLKDAIERLQETDYDVAMLDLSLPDSEGLDSLDQIRSLDARLPVVVVTGSDDEQLGLTAIETGAQDFLAKGDVTRQSLLRAIRYAIARQRKVLGIQATADTDPLTEMPNRRPLESQFKHLLNESVQNETPLSLALVDIDHFKRVNDQHGHFVGDAVLRSIAKLLVAQAPPDSFAARFGGEEFALILPGAGVKDACEIVAQILRKLQGCDLRFESTCLTVTASAGVTLVGQDETWDSAFVRADKALYQAKSLGRNQVCSN